MKRVPYEAATSTMILFGKIQPNLSTLHDHTAEPTRRDFSAVHDRRTVRPEVNDLSHLTKVLPSEPPPHAKSRNLAMFYGGLYKYPL